MQRKESLLISSRYPQSYKLQRVPPRQHPVLKLESAVKKGSITDCEFQGEEERERMGSR